MTLVATFPSEKIQETDLVTGRAVTRWTNSAAKDQHLYFTSPSVTRDDRWLVFQSERDGHPNLYAIERPEGTIHRLTDNDSGLLHSYVYPQGGPTGISKASPCLDEVRNVVYYIAADGVYRVALDDPQPNRVCELPGGWWTAFNHVSPDGKTVCVPCSDPALFQDPAQGQWDQMQQVIRRIKNGEGGTRIYRIDVESGQAEIWAEVPLWVTHVQFDPLGSGRVIFNAEGPWQDVGQRIWCLEPDGSYRPLYPQATNERSGHENWSPAGEFIIYHGRFVNEAEEGKDFVAARTWDGEIVYEYPLPKMSGSQHVTTRQDGRSFVTDGLGDYVSLLIPQGDELGIEHVCLHATEPTGRDQDAHAHPLESPHGRSIVFTSDRTGTPNVYEVTYP